VRNTVSVKEQIVSQLDKLSEGQQQQVLEFTHGLQRTLPPGTPGGVLIARAREINFDPEDLAEIVQAIEEDCERIDWDEWK
jgi:hypothetical protein